MNITFEQLPQAVTQLFDKLESIERLLQNKQNPATSEEEQLLTIEEAAEFLHLAKPTVYAYVQKKLIPFSKVAKRLYFSKKELMAWVEMGRQRTQKEIESDAEKFLSSKRS